MTNRLPDGRSTASAEVKGGDAEGAVRALAVSPDGRRLAYLMHPAVTGCAAEVELRVRDLTTGAELVWREPASPASRDARRVAELHSLSWSPDGRYVSAGASFELVDTAGTGRVLRGVPDDPVSVGEDQFCMPQDRAFRGATGELVGYFFCGGGPGSGVYVLDRDRPVRLLIPAPSDTHYTNGEVEFDASGDHALLRLTSGAGASELYRWDRDRGLRAVDTGGREVDGIDW